MRKLRAGLLFLLWFVGLGALAGGAGMLIDPTGRAMSMDAILPYFQVLPFAGVVFQDFIFSGIMLILVNGVTQLSAAVLLHRGHPFGLRMALLCGVLLMAWICIQFVIFPFNFMSTLYFIFGLAEAVMAALLLRRARG